MGKEEDEVADLEEGRRVQGVQTDEGDGRAGDENAELIEEHVEGVELAVAGEGRVIRRVGRAGKGVEERGRDALVDGVFGDVHEEKGEHIGDEESPGAPQVLG